MAEKDFDPTAPTDKDIKFFITKEEKNALINGLTNILQPKVLYDKNQQVVADRCIRTMQEQAQLLLTIARNI